MEKRNFCPCRFTQVNIITQNMHKIIHINLANNRRKFRKEIYSHF